MPGLSRCPPTSKVLKWAHILGILSTYPVPQKSVISSYYKLTYKILQDGLRIQVINGVISPISRVISPQLPICRAIYRAYLTISPPFVTGSSGPTLDRTHFNGNFYKMLPHPFAHFPPPSFQGESYSSTCWPGISSLWQIIICFWPTCRHHWEITW